MPAKNTECNQQLEIALLLIKAYEYKHYPIPAPDAIGAIKVKMLEIGLCNKDLVDKIGSKGYVSAILNRKKPLILEIAKFFHNELDVLAEVLLARKKVRYQ